MSVRLLGIINSISGFSDWSLRALMYALIASLYAVWLFELNISHTWSIP
jgi:hypothetical protein